MSHRLQVLIPAQLDVYLQQAAQRSRMSKGAWVRKALEDALGLSGEAAMKDPVAQLASLNAPTGDIEQVLEEIEAGRN